jgi:chromosome segregation ATPase
MDIEEARAWITSSATQRYLEQIDSDADDALDTAQQTLAAMRLFPTSYSNEYRRSATNLENAMGAFNTEVNQITLGRARDGRAALAAYRAYVAALMLLEAQNTRYVAFVRANVADLAARFIDAAITNSERLRRRFRDVQRQLQQLERDLPRLRREITEAHGQRAVNVLITAVGLLLPQVSIGAGLAIAAGTFTVQIILDTSLGPGRPSAIGAGNSAFGDLIGLPRSIPTPLSRFLGAASGFVSWSMDNDEIDEAERNLRNARRTLDSLTAEMPRLVRALRDAVDNIDVARNLLEGAIRTARAAADAYRANETAYRALERELAALR